MVNGAPPGAEPPASKEQEAFTDARELSGEYEKTTATDTETSLPSEPVVANVPTIEPARPAALFEGTASLQDTSEVNAAFQAFKEDLFGLIEKDETSGDHEAGRGFPHRTILRFFQFFPQETALSHSKLVAAYVALWAVSKGQNTSIIPRRRFLASALYRLSV